MLLEQRPELVSERYDDEGIALVWTVPWDGSSSDAIPLDECDPFFIEICRRLRFVDGDDGLECWRANSGDYRMAGVRDLNGLTGDPWTPIDVSDSKALTVTAAGFDYRLVHRILFETDLQSPPAVERMEAEKQADQAYLVAMALVRGQGKTEGLHRRVIPIPSGAWSILSTPSEREQMAEHSSWRVEKASDVSKSVLRSALYGLYAAGRDTDPQQLADKAQPWIDRFDDAVDERFFDELWTSIEMRSEEARADWETSLRQLAKEILDEAIDAAPLPEIRRWRAISDAESRFWNGVRKELNRTLDDSDDETLSPTEEAV
jgi:CRISPR system Cascade subunit CasA